MANIILCREIGQTRLEKLANQLKFPAKIQNRGERFGRKRKNMYLCHPFMGVRNLPPGPEGRQAESAQGAPAQHIPPLQDRKADMNTP